ncbi:hypothetical protein NECAME_16594 [Necator americanus]|uniref:Phlebovirus glycoprotein G2 fusion domain-containing protein n=1 Tax=Necator americanus TaxID=51031 RepID=W2TUW7_NECAM|nr:hypothetical protein NECAME_16594 [Necator americanus]ETN85895.1 hypothetical protein NECAME_16594 [Necator americanus]
MGRIVELKETTDGTVREAVVILPSHRKIRRPINLLVPLELEDDHKEEHKEDDSSSANCDGETTLNQVDKQLSDNTTTNEDGVNTALWEPNFTPALHCPTAKAAEELQCDVFEDCTCYSAETKANCKCKSLDIAARFQNLQYRLPVVTPSLSFRQERDGTIQARVPAMTTSEIIMTFQDDLSTKLLVDDAICTVGNADRLLQMCERMNVDEIYGDTTHLAELIRVRALTLSQLEAELRLVLDAIHQQVRIASTLALQWDHIKNDNAFQSAPSGEQILITSRCLRTAEVTKERVLRLGTRYILTDLVYENHSFTGRMSRFDRQDWLMKDHKLDVRSDIVLELINRQKRLLEAEIREMEAFLGRQEKALNDEYARVEDRVSTVLKREFELLHDQLDGRSNEQVEMLIDMLTAQKKEMQQLKQTIQRMEESSNVETAAPDDRSPSK